METLKTIFIILEVLLLFNLLIGVHELGHFLAAKWRGLKIDRFAIWFGKPIWMKKVNGVEYALGWIPAGGYVALPQMASMEAIEGKSENSGQQLPPVSALDKIIVAFAGPLFSFLLAVAFALVVWQVGKPAQVTRDDSTMIGWADPNGPAWKAGLRPGDRIVSIDGHPVTQFVSQSQDSVKWRIITSESSKIAVTYLRDGEQHTIDVEPKREQAPWYKRWYRRRALPELRILPGSPAIIGYVATNSPAAVAGLKTNDEVIAINGKPVLHWYQINDLENTSTNDPIPSVTFTIRRGNEHFDVPLKAERPVQPKTAEPSFGVMLWVVNLDEKIIHPDPVEQIKDSAGQIIATLKTVLSPKSEVGFQQLGGPVMIARAYKTFFDSENGWRRVLWFSVVLNVNLALLNLLPFPVLDGGHIVLSMLEVIRRRPVSAKLLQALQTACAMVLIAFMLCIAFLDIGDWVRYSGADRPEPVVFKPKN